MVIVVLVVGAGALFAGGVAAGRYAGWLGIAVPPAVTWVLGEGWEWDPDAIPLIAAAAITTGVGWFCGFVRREGVRRSA